MIMMSQSAVSLLLNLSVFEYFTLFKKYSLLLLLSLIISYVVVVIWPLYYYNCSIWGC